jgi:hypothetical protein
MGRSSASAWILALCTLLAGARLPAEEPGAHPTVRDLMAAPDRYANRPVAVTGRFLGRSPDRTGSAIEPPGGGRWDFLITEDGATVWVTGMRPVGRDFDLDPRAPAAAGRWLHVVGVLRVAPRRGRAACRAQAPCGHIWIEASDLQLAAPPGRAAMRMDARQARVPRVVFNDPLQGETGVAPDTTVRVQFSQHIAVETLSGRLRVSYASPAPLASPPVPEFSATYRETTRSIEVRFATPLAADRDVRVELLPEVRALDGRPLEPWELTFRTAAPAAASVRR